jgi:2-polyprenyl-6-hydroxyphenyl methylase/3-demethylubiquinone-9 3-methyltransferase
LASKLLVIKVGQEWRLTRFIDTTLHDWAMFIKPEELATTLGRHGLQIGEIVGLGPRVRKPVVLLNFVRANRGRISYGELSRRLDFGQVKEASVPYMCFASKTG